MYKIKQLDEDFVVEEESSVKISDRGDYLVYLLRKVDETTETAVGVIAGKLGIGRKNIGYAGLKDRKAVTKQYISIKGSRKEKVDGLRLKKIGLEFVGYSREPISLGDLKGNKFEIVVRNLDKGFKVGRVLERKRFVNYFGEQRFSKDNARIGKMIVKKRFKEAIDVMVKTGTGFDKEIKEYLEKNPTDYINAIRVVPRKIVMLYVNSYQSLIWNKTAQRLVEKGYKGNIFVPLVGFGTEIKDREVRKIVQEELEREGIGMRDFIIKEIPNLSIEGGERGLFAEAKRLEISKMERDELNKERYKVKICFFLGKGSYATEFIRQVFS